MAKNTTVPDTGRPRGRDVSGDRPPEKGNARSPATRGSAAENAVALLVHRAGLEQQPTPRERLAGAPTALLPVFLIGSRKPGWPADACPHPNLQPQGETPLPQGAPSGLDSPGGAQPLVPAPRAHPAGPQACCTQPPGGAAGRTVTLRRPCPGERERPRASTRPSPSPRTPAASAPGPLTGSVLSAVSGVRGGAAGQVPAGRCGGAGGGGCLSRAGCVSSASCRSRM